MSNSYFRFKQFNVQQEKCAMKVCTDACLFGALVAKSPWLKGPRVLDIGAGTGLLSLMLAQQQPGLHIDAIEIDPPAASQAAENFAASPWAERLRVFPTALQEFAPQHEGYDFMISNPPFFENDLKSKQSNRNLALHSGALSLQELVIGINRLLKPDGKFAVLLPYHRTTFFEEAIAAHQLCMLEKIYVQQTPVHAYFRSILVCSRTQASVQNSEMTIKDSQGNYSPAFVQLLADYYLYL